MVTAAKITIEIDADKLASYTGEFLATCWHLAQANPAPFGDREADELAERIGREIIRRWLREVRPEPWHRQGRHGYWDELRKLGKWVNGVFVPQAAEAPGDRGLADELGGAR